MHKSTVMPSLNIVRDAKKVVTFETHLWPSRSRCICVCVPRKRFLGNCWSHRDGLRHENAPCVNYIDLDLHSRSHRLNHENNTCLIISQNYSSNAHQVCCENSRLKAYNYDNCQSEDLDLHSVTIASISLVISQTIFKLLHSKLVSR